MRVESALRPGEGPDHGRGALATELTGHPDRCLHEPREVDAVFPVDELGATGFPKTSGGNGLHVYVRIKPDHGFQEVRRAALAFAREVERRAPEDVTTTWWRKDRDPEAIFVDYNQNARDRTVASAYSVRPVPDARVSTPLDWDEVPDVEPVELRLPHGVIQWIGVDKENGRTAAATSPTGSVTRRWTSSRWRSSNRSTW